MKVNFNQRVKPGYTVYDYDMAMMQCRVCLWFLYPVGTLYAIVRELKYRFYHWLNVIGIMQTPEGGRMCFKGIRIKDIGKEKPLEFKSAIAGYFKYDTENKEEMK